MSDTATTLPKSFSVLNREGMTMAENHVCPQNVASSCFGASFLDTVTRCQRCKTPCISLVAPGPVRKFDRSGVHWSTA